MTNMNTNEVGLLLNQVKNIILNKPIPEGMQCESNELSDLQQAIFYLANCLSESNEFLRQVSVGNLDAKVPSRHNFMAGNLKELHSWLQHLTWQANQVASGDYNQQVKFLGDFSVSFNKMISQLSEREEKLKQQSKILMETNTLTMSIMDGLKDWIIVTSKETGEVIYSNQAANELLYDVDKNTHACGENCELLKMLKSHSENESDNSIFDYYCSTRNKVLRVRRYLIQWNENLSYVHYILDVTYEKEEEEHIKELAYRDELTNLYNRRYCIEKLDELLIKNEEFTFCMVDLDGLKFANDKFGHASGDEYLKTVSEEMVKITRSTDIVCRFGGDEFAIIFHSCLDNTAKQKLEMLNSRLSALQNDYKMSVSYGAIYVASGEVLTTEQLMVRADELMYVHKRGKRLTYL